MNVNGKPAKFSVDIPRRCQMPIDELWPLISEKRDDGSLPLNASFLLAISTPMINLPIERIWKPEMGHAVGHLNDGVLSGRLAGAMRENIANHPISQAPFYQPDVWRYHYLPKGTGLPDLSQGGLPADVGAALESPAGLPAGAALTAALFCKILRNGLAHGGVLYLDEHGRSTPGAPVRAFCFVSTKEND
ncbi:MULTISPECIES: hypothetical protein [Rhizobium]|uniref:Uncharacterized protein n=1 Tax=Rhizobium leguminosarum TaxID=384 RepID=A0A1L3ZHQ6_RHILE|nr:hypothetical protein [Rhizobium leguminosarum]API55176.1 hypothetical protein BMW22_26685 [Rhizobium leguminosarum]